MIGSFIVTVSRQMEWLVLQNCTREGKVSCHDRRWDLKIDLITSTWPGARPSNPDIYQARG
jgi:hypothetical protein